MAEVSSNKGTVTRFNTATRKRKALELRLQGLPYEKVAKQAGYSSAAAAYNAVSKELKNIPREAAEAAREAELSRLDQLQAGAMKKATQGDLLALDRVLKVIQERSKLLGLYDLSKDSDPEAQRVKTALGEFLANAITAATPTNGSQH